MKHYKVNFNGFKDDIVLSKTNKNVKQILILNENFFCTFIIGSLHRTDFFFDGFSKNIIVNRKSFLQDHLNIKKINFYLSDLFSSFFIKVKFKGKGYRLQSFRKKKIMNFTFGHSHIYLMLFRNNYFKRMNKYKYIFLEKNKNIFNNLKEKIRKIKPINKYTLRGLRITKSKITKRKGRKSPTL